eukprot:jgi/Picsp_1/751/NSC_04240-R1_---NA---
MTIIFDYDLKVGISIALGVALMTDKRRANRIHDDDLNCCALDDLQTMNKCYTPLTPMKTRVMTPITRPTKREGTLSGAAVTGRGFQTVDEEYMGLLQCHTRQVTTTARNMSTL